MIFLGTWPGHRYLMDDCTAQAHHQSSYSNRAWPGLGTSFLGFYSYLYSSGDVHTPSRVRAAAIISAGVVGSPRWVLANFTP